MAGIDACVRMLLEHGPELFDTFAKRLERDCESSSSACRLWSWFVGRSRNLGLMIMTARKTRVATHRSGIAGPELSGMLRSRYQLEMEMDSEHYVTAITTVAGYGGRAATAGRGSYSDRFLSWECRPGKLVRPFAAWKNEAVLRIGEAAEAGKKSILLAKSEGSISAEFVLSVSTGHTASEYGESGSAASCSKSCCSIGQTDSRLREWQITGERKSGL